MEKVNEGFLNANLTADAPCLLDHSTPGSLGWIDQVLVLLGREVGQDQACGSAGSQAAVLEEFAPFQSLLSSWPLDIRFHPSTGGFQLATAVLDWSQPAAGPADPAKGWRAQTRKVLAAMVSGGQGFDRSMALKSCLGEMAERLSLVSRGLDDPAIFPKDQGLADIAAGQLLRFSRDQERRLADRHSVLARHSTEAGINWNGISDRRVRAEPLGGGDPVQVPALGQIVGEGVWCGLPDLPLASSAGTAVWTDQTGARLRALNEAVERDAIGLCWYNRLGITPLHQGVWQEVLPDICADLIAARPRVTRVFCVPTAFSHHVVVALSWIGEGKMGAAGFASGASAAGAVASAVLELMQGERMLELRLAVQASPAQTGVKLPLALDLAINQDIREAFHVQPDTAALTRLPPDFAPGDLERSLMQRDVRTYFIDLTREDIGLSCAKVVSPDLVDWQPRFGSSRLFEEPLRLGLRQHAATEAEFAERPFPF